MGNSASKVLKAQLTNYLRTGDRTQLEPSNLNQFIENVQSEDDRYEVLRKTTNKKGFTSVQLAALKGHTDILIALLQAVSTPQRLKLVSSRNGSFNSLEFGLGESFIKVAMNSRNTCSIMACLDMFQKVNDYESTCSEVVKSILDLLEDKAASVVITKDSNGVTIMHYLAAMGYVETINCIKNLVTVDQWKEVLQTDNISNLLTITIAYPLFFARNTDRMSVENRVELICKMQRTRRHKPTEVIYSLFSVFSRGQLRQLLNAENLQDSEQTFFPFIFGYIGVFEALNLDCSLETVTTQIQVAFKNEMRQTVQFLRQLLSEEEIHTAVEIMISNAQANVLLWSAALEDVSAVELIKNSVKSSEEWMALLMTSVKGLPTPLQQAALCKSFSVMEAMVSSLTAKQVFRLVLPKSGRETSTGFSRHIAAAIKLAKRVLDPFRQPLPETSSLDIFSKKSRKLLLSISEALSHEKLTDVLCIQDRDDDDNTLFHIAIKQSVQNENGGIQSWIVTRDTKVSKFVQLFAQRLTSNGLCQILSVRDSKGRTIIHMAAHCGYTKTISLLLSPLTSAQAFNILSKQDTRGMTALHNSATDPPTLKCIFASITPSQQISLIDTKDISGHDVITLTRALSEDCTDDAATFPEETRQTAEMRLSRTSSTMSGQSI